jgi:predicted Zn-dependent protease
MTRNLHIIIAISISVFFLSSCGKINLLSLEDERQLGEQAKAQIAQDPSMPILSPAANSQAYGLLESMKNDILNSGSMEHAADFNWELFIIKDDATLNAFCTPGGKIYFFTGLMKYLDNSSAVAGVMGHEMAHADRRHSGKQLTNQMGLQILLTIVAGTSGNDIAQMVGLMSQLGALKFSRDHETEADSYSVRFLCPTRYQSDGAYYFFQKLIDQGQSPNIPTYMSTHPDPGDRVNNIKTQAAAATSCTAKTEGFTNDTKYIAIRNSIN